MNNQKIIYDILDRSKWTIDYRLSRIYVMNPDCDLIIVSIWLPSNVIFIHKFPFNSNQCNLHSYEIERIVKKYFKSKYI